MHERSGRSAGAQKIYNQIERLRMQDRWRLEIFPSSGRARQNKNSRTDDGADTKRSQRPGPQRLAEPVLRVLRLRNQFIDRLTTERLLIRSTDDDVGGPSN